MSYPPMDGGQGYPPMASPGGGGYPPPQGGSFQSPYPASPTQVLNPLQTSAITATPVPLGGMHGGGAGAMPMSPPPITITRSLSGVQVLAAGQRFTKNLKVCTCFKVGKHGLLVAPGHIVADQTGCCCSFKREVMAAKDIMSWATETSAKCGGTWCCCPGSARVEVRANVDTGVVRMRASVSDCEPSGPLHNAMRAAVNADKRSAVITNDGAGRSFNASTCVCFCFDVVNKITLGGAGSSDVTAVRVEEGCCQKQTRTDATQAADVAWTSFTNSIGSCACIQSNLGACHCGEQLVLGLRDKHQITVATNKGEAREAVAELYRRSRHPMMPEPSVVRKIPGSTACCGQESELTVSTESVTLAKWRYPTGCFPCAPCQAQENVSISLDDVRVVRVEEESPCTNAGQVLRGTSGIARNVVESLVTLNIFGVLAGIFSLVLSLPKALVEGVLGLLCLPCRRAFVVVDGPADLAFRVRPKADAGASAIGDFAVELHQQLRALKEQRAGALAGILSGAGKEQVLFTSVEVVSTPAFGGAADGGGVGGGAAPKAV